jgi:hypothetical protein
MSGPTMTVPIIGQKAYRGWGLAADPKALDS